MQPRFYGLPGASSSRMVCLRQTYAATPPSQRVLHQMPQAANQDTSHSDFCSAVLPLRFFGLAGEFETGMVIGPEI